MIYDWQNDSSTPRGRLYDLDSGEEIIELVFYLNTDCPYSHEYRHWVMAKSGGVQFDEKGNRVVKVVKGAKVKFVPNQENPR